MSKGSVGDKTTETIKETLLTRIAGAGFGDGQRAGRFKQSVSTTDGAMGTSIVPTEVIAAQLTNGANLPKSISPRDGMR